MQGASGQGRCNAMRVVVTMMVCLCASKAVLATNFKVGDASGWTLTTYDSWVAGKTFVVGDTLEFVYSGAHDVVEVSEAEYTACSKGSSTVHTDGDTTFTLDTTGSKYYICSVSDHCSRGMQVAVTVSAASTPPTTSPTPSTPPTSSPTPTSPSTTPSPTTPSTTPTTPSTPTSPNTTTTPSPPNSSPLSLPPPIFTLFLILGITFIFF